MKKSLLLLALAALSISASAQAAQSCLCTSPTGCQVTGNSYPPGPGQPTSFIVKDASGGFIATAPAVPSTSIPLSNAAACSPADAAYVPGPAGSVSPLVTVGPYPAGNNLTFVLYAVNSAGTSPLGATLAFLNVTTLPIVPVIPATPTGARHASLPDWAIEGIQLALAQ